MLPKVLNAGVLTEKEVCLFVVFSNENEQGKIENEKRKGLT